MATKKTAHRPSQSDQEFVKNSKGEKVRNTAYVPQDTRGRKDKTQAYDAQYELSNLDSLSSFNPRFRVNDGNLTDAEKTERLNTVLDLIEQSDSPEDIDKVYDIAHDALWSSNYRTQGREVLLSFAENTNTSADTLEKAYNDSIFRDMWHGVDQEVADNYRNHPNASDELKADIDSKYDSIVEQTAEMKQFWKEEDHAQEAFARDPELKNRLRSAREQRTIKGGDHRKVVFEASDVEAVGKGYIARNYLGLFGVKYEGDGVFTGYIS